MADTVCQIELNFVKMTRLWTLFGLKDDVKKVLSTAINFVFKLYLIKEFKSNNRTDKENL